MADIEVLVEGNQRIVRAAFKVPPDTGALTDPTTVKFTARRKRERGDQPSAYASRVYTFGTDSEVQRTPGFPVGGYDLTFVPGQGTWVVHVQGTGAAYAAGEVEFVVKRSEALDA